MSTTPVAHSSRPILTPFDGHLWDFAGVDGLQVAIALFSSQVSHLAPFQSLTAEFHQQTCAVLRLCEGNFRVALPLEFDLEQAVNCLDQTVWVKPCQTANLIVPASSGLERLAQIATTKPVFTLKPFPRDRAVPARINGTAILAWHLSWQGQPALLLQTAVADADQIRAFFDGST